MPDHERKCRDCGNIAIHADNVVQDTRVVMEKLRASSDEHLKRLSLVTLPMSFDAIGDVYARAYSIELQRICESHERLRFELSGAESVIADLEAKIAAHETSDEQRREWARAHLLYGNKPMNDVARVPVCNHPSKRLVIDEQAGDYEYCPDCARLV